MTLFIEIPCVPDGATPGELRFIESVKCHLQSNYSNHNFSVSQLAALMKLSTVQLNRKVYNLTGYGPARLILDYRMQVARHLLAYSAEPVKNIARLTGFRAHGSFCRCFIKAFQQSASCYRETLSRDMKVSLPWKIPVTMDAARIMLKQATELDWIRQMISTALFHEYTDISSVPIMAALFNTTQSTLNRKLKELFQVSPRKFIRDLKLQYAAELLHANSCTVIQAHLTAGFFDQAHFCHSFKNAFGVVPSKFRISNKDEMPVSWLKQQLMKENVK